ncbi:MAG: helix-turn-helix domain-containing protein [Planctomycetota bacterium]
MKLEIVPDELRPVIEAVVAETIAKLEVQREALNGKLAYSEYEAAQLIGLNERQLADERRRGRIKASSIVGRRIRYLKSDLIEYMLSRR